TAPLRGYVLESRIPYKGRKVSQAVFARLIFQVDLQHCLLANANLNIPDVYIFYHSSAAIGCLDPYHPQQLGAVHLAVLNEEIGKPSGDLASNDHTSVAVSHTAVSDNNVF